jgi:hypothetical protein
MSLPNDVIAALATGLVLPAVLFVGALFARQVPPPHAQPARSADRIVRWYSDHPQLGLWVLLLLLPMTAFVLGSAALLRTWAENPMLRYYTWRAITSVPEHYPAFLLAIATMASAGVLAMMAKQLMRA